MTIDKYPADKEYKNFFNTLMTRIWIDAPLETQQRNKEMLNDILSLAQESYEEKVESFNEPRFKTPKYEETIRKEISKLAQRRDLENFKILKNTKFKFSKENFDAFVQYSVKNKQLNANNIQELFDLYNQIYKYNNNINSTLNIDILEILGNEVDVMQLVRITSADNLIQEKLSQMLKSNEVTKQIIFTSINSSEYWDTEISAIDKNYYSFRELLKNIDAQDVEVSKQDLEKLKNVMLQKNYFNIETIEDVRNYEEIKNNICQKILNGEKLSKEYEYINEMNKETREKFAILEMQYGISLEDAINIVEKYGTDIYEISDNQYANVIEQVKDLKKVLNTENVAELYKENRNKLYIPTTLENECLNLYAKLYQKDFDDHCVNKNIQSISQVEYNNENINVVNISPYMMVNGNKKRGEISAFVRVEGAYADWQEPENFREALEAPSVLYHGNCKSHIRSNNMAIACPKGPTYWYDTCKKNTLKLMAPWDIVSTYGNTSFAINSLKWNQNVDLFATKRITGVQFRTPTKNTDNTRHGHNEAVSERLVSDGKKFTKDEPDFILFMTEAGETIEEYEALLKTEDFNERLKLVNEKEKDLTDEEYKILNADKWRVSKKAAMQLNKDIYTMDRDEIRECEEKRLEQLLEAFENPERNIDFIEDKDKNLSEMELLEKVIVEFENNVTGTSFARNKGLFDAKNREYIYNRIQTRIDSMKKSNPVRYNELYDKLEEICEAEFNKSYSNVGKEVALPSFKEFYEEKTLSLKTEREHETGREIQTLDFNERGVQYSQKIKTAIEEINKTDLYEGNKHHSIDHVDKVILFAGLLAKNEGLDEKTTNLLITASAFHDSGRKTLGTKVSDQNIYHAEKSAEVAKELLEKNPENKFEVNNEDIKIIQVAIHYHEHEEANIGKTDKGMIKELCDKYGVKQEDFETTLKVSELLKDADALDRTRFTKNGKLDTRYLKSENAKKGSMINYAKQVNEELAKEILIQEYDIKEEELQDIDAVSKLYEKKERQYLRGISRQNEVEEIEGHLDVSKKIELMQKVRVYEEEPKTKNELLMNLYNKFSVDKESVLQAKGMLKKTLDKLRDMFKERS